MHRSEHFGLAEAAAFDLVRDRVLGTLVVADGAGFEASPLPFVLHDDATDRAVLRSHVSRANPIANKGLAGPALVVFAGADAYVSPRWYPSKDDGGRVVPTWNYVAVHVHGRLRLIDDTDWLAVNVRDLTDRHEQVIVGEPWSVDDAPQDFISGLLRGIVGVEVTVERVEGKAKLSQNRSDADRAGVIAGLGASESAGAAVAAHMTDPAR